MKLMYAAIVFLQFVLAVTLAAHAEGSKTVSRPIAVIAPVAAPHHDIDREAGSFYALEDPDVVLTDTVEDEDTDDRLKRTMGMLRMGRSLSGIDEEKRTMGMLRMGKKAMGMLRMGRSFSADDEPAKRSMGMLRMGRSSDELNEKRSMGMLRMGRGFDNDDDEKRSMGMLRMGRSSSSDVSPNDKRSMSMLRMGK